jgi:hypothetical protein
MPHLQVDLTVQQDGVLRVSSLTVGLQGVLTTATGLQVESSGDIVILGQVQSQPGRPLSLTSRTGNIVIIGQVVAGRGRDGQTSGEAGHPGGPIHLLAPEGQVVVAGVVRAGAGGNGAAAINFPGASNTRGGAGGKGGEILVQGRRICVRAGRIISGAGGNGGTALAEGWDFEAISQWILEHTRMAGTPADISHEPMPEWVPPDEIAEKVLVALSGDGGLGGDVRMIAKATAAMGWALPGASLESGNGGNAPGAEALRGTEAWAMTGRPGNGGHILYEIRGGSGGWQRNAAEKPGAGGSAGKATAGAINLADARISDGGRGGEVLMQGAPTGVKGDGGGTGVARVHTATCAKTAGPTLGGQNGPAAGVVVRCP